MSVRPDAPASAGPVNHGAPGTPRTPRIRATIDLDAIQSNVRTLIDAAAPAQVMPVVKADAYGHGLLPVAHTAVAAGAGWLGVASVEEALELRAGGIEVPVLAWLITPGEALAAAVAAGVDLGLGAVWLLEDVRAAARVAGRTARIHLKVDTGLSRGGAMVDDWPGLVAVAARAAAEGSVEVVGAWSHLVHADAPGHPTTGQQLSRFAEALEVVRRAGLRPEVRHLANSAATLTLPAAHFDVVRPGIAVYGLSPIPAVAGPAQLGLRPAMTLSAAVALTKRVPAGAGVSYGHQYTTATETTLALVPAGYADGIPRNATNAGPVLLRGRRRSIAGRVCMDQFVVDAGDDPVRPGDEVVLFGPGDDGEPTAQDWADAVDTISYEIVTRVGPRVPRVHSGQGWEPLRSRR